MHNKRMEGGKICILQFAGSTSCTTYIPHRKKKSRQKMTNFFASDEFFLPMIIFYRRLIFTDEHSYRHLFYKREHLVFSNLKIPLVYLFDFKFD